MNGLLALGAATIGTIPFVPLFLAYPRHNGREPMEMWAIAAVVWMLCGVAFLVFSRRFLDRRPVVTIDKDGIADRRLADGRITWKEIRTLKTFSLPTIYVPMTYLSIELNDASRTIHAKNFWRRFSWRVDSAIGGGHINILLSDLADVPNDFEFMRFIEQHKSDLPNVL